MKNKTRFMILFICSIVAMTLSITYSLYSTNHDYSLAEKFCENENYQLAQEKYESLGNYRDANEKANLLKQYNYAINLMETGSYEKAIGELNALLSDSNSDSLFNESNLDEKIKLSKYQYALQLIEEGVSDRARDILLEISGYKDSALLAKELLLQSVSKAQEQTYNEALRLMNNNRYKEALELFDELISSNYEPAIKKAEECRQMLSLSLNTFSAGAMHSTAITTLGEIRATGSIIGRNDPTIDSWNKIDEWKDDDIISVAAGGSLTMGLRRSGTVSVKGTIINSESVEAANWNQWTKWQNIISISAGGSFGVGLRTDGKVESFGYNEKGQTNVSNWEDVVAISAGTQLTVGLLNNGKVVIAGYNAKQLEENINKYYEPDNPIVAIAGGGANDSRRPGDHGHTVILREDGTVRATGDNHTLQCDVERWYNPLNDPPDYKIIAISAGGYHTVGLRANGTVISTDKSDPELEEWSDIVAISAGFGFTLGLRKDGVLLSCGYHYQNQRPKSEGDAWTEKDMWTDIALQRYSK